MSTTKLTSPGVYVEERRAFSQSVVAVDSAIPAFIGYTAQIQYGQQNLLHKPMLIESLKDFERLFGKQALATFTIQPDENLDFILSLNHDAIFYLYDAIRLFYKNGGGSCYIVSIGTYQQPFQMRDFEKALKTLEQTSHPSLLLIPDAVRLSASDCYMLQQQMLQHCGLHTRDRVALLDIYRGATQQNDLPQSSFDLIDTFRNNIGTQHLDFGAAYYPWLLTNLYNDTDLSFQQFENIEVLQDLLKKESQEYLDAEIISESRHQEILDRIDQIPNISTNIHSFTHILKKVSPMLQDIFSEMAYLLNIQPPSAAVAGVFASVDQQIGVHKAPANVSITATLAPEINISTSAQQHFNLPLSGKAVNAIRSFPGRGTLVWGARTLDGNSKDWRYISVRRTVCLIEQSIKTASEAFVFEPNTNATWSKLRTMINSFLHQMWTKGALVGSTASEAYNVDVGLGTTMSQEDILEGTLRVSVKLAVSRPAEFIVITFEQKMQEN